MITDLKFLQHTHTAQAGNAFVAFALKAQNLSSKREKKMFNPKFHIMETLQ